MDIPDIDELPFYDESDELDRDDRIDTQRC